LKILVEDARRPDAGRALTALLVRDPARAEAAARALAPAGSGPGARYHTYRDTMGAAATRARFQDAFTDIGAFLEPLEAGDPGAVELGLELAGRLHPDDVVPIAARLLDAPIWNGLGLALAHALGRVEAPAARAAALALMLDHGDAAYVLYGLDALGPAPDPSPVEVALDALEATGRLTSPVTPSDRIAAEKLLGYLARTAPERGLPRVEDVYVRGPEELFAWAAGRLGAQRTARGAEVRAACRDAPRPELRTLGIRLALRHAPESVVDWLGGLAALTHEAGAEQVLTLLAEIASDGESAARGGTSRGFATADPRFVELAVAWSRDKRTGHVAARVMALLPAEAVKAAKRRAKKAPARPKRSRAPAELMTELRELRQVLERVVAFLQRRGYRFRAEAALVAPSARSKRAMTTLEREVGPLPAALRAFWEVVGAVDLSGQDPAWPCPACLALPGVTASGTVWHTDPLVIAGPDEVLEVTLEDVVDGAPTAIVVAPDAVGKAGYSGGQRMVWSPAPAGVIDPPLEGGRPGETLLEHLRAARRWGGFPGFATIEDPPGAWLDALSAACGRRPVG